jgi:hypothetical protein
MRITSLLLVVMLSLPCVAGSGKMADSFDMFRYDGNTERIKSRTFIQEVRRRTGGEKLTERRIKELIFYTEVSVYVVNKKIEETTWDSGIRLTTREILENIATEVAFSNEKCKAPWEDEYNYGYMQLRLGTAWNALIDMKMTKLYERAIPPMEALFKKDVKFQQYLIRLLMEDPKLNILLGAWIHVKLQNLVDGSLRDFIGSYTMGRTGFLVRQKKNPNQPLSPTAQVHMERWKRWRSLWRIIGNDGSLESTLRPRWA